VAHPNPTGCCKAVIDPMRALTAGPLNQLGTVLQSLANASTSATVNEGTARKLQDEVVATMKRILDQMSQWESFVDVVNQVAEVIKMEQKVCKPPRRRGRLVRRRFSMTRLSSRLSPRLNRELP